MEYITVVCMLVLLEFIYFGVLVGKARGKYNIKGPATTGNEAFERIYRVQANTLEQLIIFFPAIWAFGFYLRNYYGYEIGAGLGLVFILGRWIYYKGYTDPNGNRSSGFLIAYLATAVLVLGGLVGALLHIFF